MNLLRLSIGLSVFVVIKLAAATESKKKVKAPKIKALEVSESYTVPTLEISGMAWRTNPATARRELVLVGDRNHKIFLIDWETRKQKFAPREIDLKPIEKKAGPVSEQSEWESVFSDETGRLFIVQERPPMILVVSADLSKIEKRIDLVTPAESKASGDPKLRGNSGGEGILPLKNGHVLVVKEKDPLRIVEYTPLGKKAVGYNSGLSVEQNGKFPLPQDARLKFHNAFEWRLASEHETLFEDSSGINVDRKGRLYLLGDQRNLIGRIGKKLKVNSEVIDIDRLWSLPSVIKQPEGMVVDGEDRPIIAVDRKDTKRPNLFLLSPLR